MEPFEFEVILLCAINNNYLDQKTRCRVKIFDVCQELIEVFLVAYTCLNLNFEIFTETRPNRQQPCIQYVIEMR
jgi:hypothetical protein